MAWYFTGDGQMKVKSRAKLTTPEIRASFLKNVSSSGVVGVFMTTENLGNGKPVVYFRHLDTENFGRLYSNCR